MENPESSNLDEDELKNVENSTTNNEKSIEETPQFPNKTPQQLFKHDPQSSNPESEEADKARLTPSDEEPEPSLYIASPEHVNSSFTSSEDFLSDSINSSAPSVPFRRKPGRGRPRKDISSPHQKKKVFPGRPRVRGRKSSANMPTQIIPGSLLHSFSSSEANLDQNSYLELPSSISETEDVSSSSTKKIHDFVPFSIPSRSRVRGRKSSANTPTQAPSGNLHSTSALEQNPFLEVPSNSSEYEGGEVSSLKKMQEEPLPLWSTKICALCNLGEHSCLGQGELTRFEPTPAFNPFKRSIKVKPPESTSPSQDCEKPKVLPLRKSKSYKFSKEGKTSKKRVIAAEEQDFMPPGPLDELNSIGFPEEPDPFLLFEQTGHTSAHYCCASWSEGVVLTPNCILTNVDKAVSMGISQKCSGCKKFGASIRCKVLKCTNIYHYPCAVAAGTFQDMKTLTLLCPSHLNQAPAISGPEARCLYCENPGNLLDLIFCTSCGHHYHGSCLDPPVTVNAAVRAGWQCPDCKLCFACRQPGDDSKMLMCDACDKGYHTYCLKPIMTTVPKSGWKCKFCRLCGDCGSRTPGSGPSSRWHMNYTVCDSCYQQRNKGVACPLCGKAYRQFCHRGGQGMAQCKNCKKFIHAECDPLQIQRESGSWDPYFCSLCRNPPSHLSSPPFKEESSFSKGFKLRESLESGPESASRDSSSFLSPNEDSVSSLELDIHSPDRGSLVMGHHLLSPEGSSSLPALEYSPSTKSTSFSTGKMGATKRSRFGLNKSRGIGAKLAAKRRPSKSLDLVPKKGPKYKMKGYGIPLSLQNYLFKVTDDPPKDKSNTTEEDSGPDTKLIFCSTSDKFVLSQDLCVMCGSFGKGDEGRLLACSQCGQCYHPYCVSVKLTPVIVKKGWRCLECTVCEGCGKPHDEGRLLLCDDCDISYHTYCLDPPLEEVPPGNWKCKWCVVCLQCGSTTPGFGCQWHNNYTTCGPCASHLVCPACNIAYQENDIIIHCTQCDRWIHGKCDEMASEEDAEICAEYGYVCILCRPKDEPPPHLIPPPSPESPIDIPIESPPCTTKIKTEIEVKPKPPAQYLVDGVILSECGNNLIKELTLELPKKPRTKKISKPKPGSEDQTQDLITPCEDLLDKMDVDMDDKATEGGTPKHEGAAATPEIPTVEKKKRQRNLHRLGIGGFTARPRGRITSAKEQDGTAAADASSEAQPIENGPNDVENPSTQEKPKRKRRPKKKNTIEDSFPAYLQEAFFGRSLLEAARESGEGTPSLETFEEGKIKASLSPPLAQQDSDSKGPFDEEELKDLLPLPQDDELMVMLMNESDELTKPDQELSEEGEQRPKDPLASADNLDSVLLSPNFDLDTGLPQMDSKDVEDIFKGVLDPVPPGESPHSPSSGFMESEPSTTAATASPFNLSSPSYTSQERASPHVGTENLLEESSAPGGKNCQKWESDEALGLQSTISPVLYANINMPHLKQEYPLWIDRIKQIAKVWRNLTAEKKQPYLQKARENRAANRVTKSQVGEPTQEQERQWKQLQALRQQQQQKQQQILQEQRAQSLAKVQQQSGEDKKEISSPTLPPETPKPPAISQSPLTPQQMSPHKSLLQVAPRDVPPNVSLQRTQQRTISTESSASGSEQFSPHMVPRPSSESSPTVRSIAESFPNASLNLKSATESFTPPTPERSITTPSEQQFPTARSLSDPGLAPSQTEGILCQNDPSKRIISPEAPLDEKAQILARQQIRELLQRQQQIKKQQQQAFLHQQWTTANSTSLDVRQPSPTQESSHLGPSNVLPSTQPSKEIASPELLHHQRQALLRSLSEGERFRYPLPPGLRPRMAGNGETLFRHPGQGLRSLPPDSRLRMLMLQQRLAAARLPLSRLAPEQLEQLIQQKQLASTLSATPSNIDQAVPIQGAQEPPTDKHDTIEKHPAELVKETKQGGPAVAASQTPLDDPEDLDDDDELLGLGNDFNILEYADPELDKGFVGEGEKGNILDEHLDLDDKEDELENVNNEKSSSSQPKHNIVSDTKPIAPNQDNSTLQPFVEKSSNQSQSEMENSMMKEPLAGQGGPSLEVEKPQLHSSQATNSETKSSLTSPLLPPSSSFSNETQLALNKGQQHFVKAAIKPDPSFNEGVRLSHPPPYPPPPYPNTTPAIRAPHPLAASSRVHPVAPPPSNDPPLLLQDLVEQEKREQQQQGLIPPSPDPLLSDIEFEQLKDDIFSGPDESIGNPLLGSRNISPQGSMNPVMSQRMAANLNSSLAAKQQSSWPGALNRAPLLSTALGIPSPSATTSPNIPSPRPQFTITTLPPPPEPTTEQDHQQYEQWLIQQQNLLSNQHKYLETEINKLRKSKKALNAKQRQLRKNGNELAEPDATELLRVSNEQSSIQKHLEHIRKLGRQHSLIIQEYRMKQQKRLQSPSRSPLLPSPLGPSQSPHRAGSGTPQSPLMPPSPMGPSPSPRLQQSPLHHSPIPSPMLPQHSPLIPQQASPHFVENSRHLSQEEGNMAFNESPHHHHKEQSNSESESLSLEDSNKFSNSQLGSLSGSDQSPSFRFQGPLLKPRLAGDLVGQPPFMGNTCVRPPPPYPHHLRLSVSPKTSVGSPSKIASPAASGASLQSHIRPQESYSGVQEMAPSGFHMEGLPNSRMNIPKSSPHSNPEVIDSPYNSDNMQGGSTPHTHSNPQTPHTPGTPSTPGSTQYNARYSHTPGSSDMGNVLTSSFTSDGFSQSPLNSYTAQESPNDSGSSQNLSFPHSLDNPSSMHPFNVIDQPNSTQSLGNNSSNCDGLQQRNMGNAHNQEIYTFNRNLYQENIMPQTQALSRNIETNNTSNNSQTLNQVTKPKISLEQRNMPLSSHSQTISPSFIYSNISSHNLSLSSENPTSVISPHSLGNPNTINEEDIAQHCEKNENLDDPENSQNPENSNDNPDDDFQNPDDPNDPGNSHNPNYPHNPDNSHNPGDSNNPGNYHDSGNSHDPGNSHNTGDSGNSSNSGDSQNSGNSYSFGTSYSSKSHSLGNVQQLVEAPSSFIKNINEMPPNASHFYIPFLQSCQGNIFFQHNFADSEKPFIQGESNDFDSQNNKESNNFFIRCINNLPDGKFTMYKKDVKKRKESTSFVLNHHNKQNFSEVNLDLKIQLFILAPFLITLYFIKNLMAFYSQENLNRCPTSKKNMHYLMNFLILYFFKYCLNSFCKTQVSNSQSNIQNNNDFNASIKYIFNLLRSIFSFGNIQCPPNDQAFKIPSFADLLEYGLILSSLKQEEELFISNSHDNLEHSNENELDSSSLHCSQTLASTKFEKDEYYEPCTYDLHTFKKSFNLGNIIKKTLNFKKPNKISNVKYASLPCHYLNKKDLDRGNHGFKTFLVMHSSHEQMPSSSHSNISACYGYKISSTFFSNNFISNSGDSIALQCCEITPFLETESFHAAYDTKIFNHEPVYSSLECESFAKIHFETIEPETPLHLKLSLFPCYISDAPNFQPEENCYSAINVGIPQALQFVSHGENPLSSSNIDFSGSTHSLGNQNPGNSQNSGNSHNSGGTPHSSTPGDHANANNHGNYNSSGNSQSSINPSNLYHNSSTTTNSGTSNSGTPQNSGGATNSGNSQSFGNNTTGNPYNINIPQNSGNSHTTGNTHNHGNPYNPENLHNLGIHENSRIPHSSPQSHASDNVRTLNIIANPHRSSLLQNMVNSNLQSQQHNPQSQINLSYPYNFTSRPNVATSYNITTTFNAFSSSQVVSQNFENPQSTYTIITSHNIENKSNSPNNPNVSANSSHSRLSENSESPCTPKHNVVNSSTPENSSIPQSPYNANSFSSHSQNSPSLSNPNTSFIPEAPQNPSTPQSSYDSSLYNINPLTPVTSLSHGNSQFSNNSQMMVNEYAELNSNARRASFESSPTTRSAPNTENYHSSSNVTSFNSAHSFSRNPDISPSHENTNFSQNIGNFSNSLSSSANTSLPSNIVVTSLSSLGTSHKDKLPNSPQTSDTSDQMGNSFNSSDKTTSFNFSSHQPAFLSTTNSDSNFSNSNINKNIAFSQNIPLNNSINPGNSPHSENPSPQSSLNLQNLLHTPLVTLSNNPRLNMSSPTNNMPLYVNLQNRFPQNVLNTYNLAAPFNQENRQEMLGHPNALLTRIPTSQDNLNNLQRPRIPTSTFVHSNPRSLFFPVNSEKQQPEPFSHASPGATPLTPASPSLVQHQRPAFSPGHPQTSTTSDPQYHQQPMRSSAEATFSMNSGSTSDSSLFTKPSSIVTQVSMSGGNRPAAATYHHLASLLNTPGDQSRSAHSSHPLNRGDSTMTLTYHNSGGQNVISLPTEIARSYTSSLQEIHTQQPAQKREHQPVAKVKTEEGSRLPCKEESNSLDPQPHDDSTLATTIPMVTNLEERGGGDVKRESGILSQCAVTSQVQQGPTIQESSSFTKSEPQSSEHFDKGKTLENSEANNQNVLLKQLLQNCPSAETQKKPESFEDLGPELPKHEIMEENSKIAEDQKPKRHPQVPYPGTAPAVPPTIDVIRRTSVEAEPSPPLRDQDSKAKKPKRPKKKKCESPTGSSKKRVRKGSKSEEDYDLYMESMMNQLRAIPALRILEPTLPPNHNMCPVFGSGDLNAKESQLRGYFGHAYLPNQPDPYLCAPFGDHPPTPPISLPPTPPPNRCFYNQEFASLKTKGKVEVPPSLPTPPPHLDAPPEYRDTDSPDLVLSSSSPESCILESPIRWKGLRYIEPAEDLTLQEFDGSPPSPSIPPLVTPIPIRAIPLAESSCQDYDDKQNKENQPSGVEVSVKVKLSGPGAVVQPLKESGNVAVTLTLSSEAAQDIPGVLASLAALLNIPPPSIVDHSPASPQSRNAGSFYTGKQNFCRHCDIVVMNSGIRKKASELHNVPKEELDEDEVIFCSSNCYMQFSLIHRSIVPPEKEAATVVSHLSNPSLNARSPKYFGKDITAQTIKEEPVDNQDLSLQLSPRRWKNKRWKIWSLNNVPSPKYCSPSEDEVGKMLDSLQITIRPDKNVNDTRKCVLCHEVGDGESCGSARLLNMDVDKWVHLNCALWSSEVYETVNGALMNVDVAYKRAVNLACCHCHKVGASLKCFKNRCPSAYHFPCALATHCVFYKDKTMLCYHHASKSPNPDQELDSLAVYRRVYVNRDEHKQVASMIHQEEQHIIRIGSLIFKNIGQLLPQQIQAFHTRNAIYPVGFKVIRMYWSMKNLGKRCHYVCTIHDVEGKPEFRIQVKEQNYKDILFRDKTPKGVWLKVLDPIEKFRKSAETIKVFTNFITGEDLFGLTEPTILRILESLPGIDTLTDYNFKYGRSPHLELPLAVNPTGCARSEPKLRTHFKRPHTLHHSSSSSRSQRSSLYSPSTSLEVASPYVKQFVHSKSSQYRKMKTEWRNNVYLARSRIQGLGLYAARDIDKHTMVIEYIGQLIRNEIAERNETIYESQNRGVYMFRLDDDRVIDATLCGGLARYMNHSCYPNCVAELVQIDRENKILIIANRRISRGEELTYDYKFEVEDDQHKIPCLCGALTCRKWMN